MLIKSDNMSTKFVPTSTFLDVKIPTGLPFKRGFCIKARTVSRFEGASGRTGRASRAGSIAALAPYRRATLSTGSPPWRCSATFSIFLDCGANRKSWILGIWAASRGRKTLPKGGGRPDSQNRRFPASPKTQKNRKHVAEQRQASTQLRSRPK